MKYNINPLILILSFLIRSTSQEPIYLKLTETDNRKYTTNVCIGGGTLICDNLHVSLTQNEISVYSNCEYKPTLSITSKYIESFSKVSTLYADTIILIDSSSQESISFESYIEEIDMRKGEKAGLFGLSGDINKDVASPLYQMYKIANDKKAFYIDIHNRTITIGTYPPIMNMKQIKLFNMSESKNKKSFACKMDSVYFKSYMNEYVRYELPYTFIFCLSNNGITVPKAFAESLFNEYLGHLIREKVCKKVYSEYIYVKCKEGYDYINDKSLNDITFIMENKISMRLSRENLFTIYEKEIYFLILYNPTSDEFTFGYPFFTKYVLLIDEDKQRFGIYSQNNK